MGNTTIPYGADALDATAANNFGGLSTIPQNMRNGLTAILVFSLMSFFSTTTLLIVLGYKAFRKYRISKINGSSSLLREEYSIHTQGYVWLVNLFIADFIQSLGLVLIAHNLVNDSVLPGPLCSVQGFLINSGDIASAIWSFVIAIHTFFLLAGGRKWRVWVAEKSMQGKARWFLTLGIWFFIFFIGIIGVALIQQLNPEKGPFYNNAGAGWCWIADNYFWERIFFHYIFLFVDMFALTILYCVLFFYIRLQLKNFRKANSTTDPTIKESDSPQTPGHELSPWQANLESGIPSVQINPHTFITTKTVHVTTEERNPDPLTAHKNSLQPHTMNPDADRTHRKMNQVALTLLAYPIMYICLTLTLCITRFSEFAGDDWGFTCVYVGASIFCCTGWVNVLMYTATRKGIISWDWLFRRGRSRTNSTHLSNMDPRSESRLGGSEFGRGSNPPPYNPHFPGGPRSEPSDIDLTISKPGSSHSALGRSASVKSHVHVGSDQESVCITIDTVGEERNKLVHDRNCPVRDSFTTDGSCKCLLPKAQR